MPSKILLQIKNLFLELLFPTYCCRCRKAGKFLCDNCYEQLHFRCLPIRLKLENIYVDEVWAGFVHEQPIISLLYQLKYQSVESIGKYFGDLLYYTLAIPHTDAITSVPLHPKKKADRGFNQAEAIAKQIAHNLHLPYYDLLLRKKNTLSQAAGMSKIERARNTENLYAIKNAHQPLPKTILLVDDVITTGSTINACAKILKANGAQKVMGLAVTHRG